MLFLMLSGKTLSDFWKRKNSVQMFFPSCVLISLNNYFANGKAKKGNCCDQLPLTLPRQKPDRANSVSKERFVRVPGSAHSSLLSVIISAALKASNKIRTSWCYPYFQTCWKTGFHKEDLFHFLVAEQVAVCKCCSLSTWDAGLVAPQWFRKSSQKGLLSHPCPHSGVPWAALFPPAHLSTGCAVSDCTSLCRKRSRLRMASPRI